MKSNAIGHERVCCSNCKCAPALILYNSLNERTLCFQCLIALFPETAEGIRVYLNEAVDLIDQNRLVKP